jgi:hypothetical protein
MYFDRYFISGDYSHGAICTSKREITHAISPKVCTTHPIDFMECDRIAILRPKHQYTAEKAVELAKSFIGTPYDFDFNTGDSEEVYCFELVARCYPDIQFKKYKQRKLLFITKTTYLDSSFLENENFELVFENNPRKKVNFRKA